MKFPLSRRFLKALRDPERKGVKQILNEYLRLKIRHPEIAEQYFVKYLYRKDSGDIHAYLNNNRIHKKFWDINHPAYLPALAVKKNFESFLSQYGIPVVRNYAYNRNALFFKDDSLILINSPGKFLDFILSLSPDKAFFIKKNENSFGGKDIFRVNPGKLQRKSDSLEKIFQQVIQSGYIFQEEIRQHEKMKWFNPNCVNTIRIITYTNRKRKSKIMGSFLRTALNDSYLDNVSSGGGFIGIDHSKGKLYNKLYTFFEKGPGKVYGKHPLTGLKFEGIEIPFYHEACDIAVKAASLVAQINLVGWDIAIQPYGPVCIEGNIRPGLNGLEIAQKGYKNNPVYLEMLGDFGEYYANS